MKPSRFTERADHRDLAGAGGWCADCRRLPQARDQQRDVLKGGRPNMAGLEGSDAKRLKALEDENAKLKKLLAEGMLDNALLKDVAAKKW
jgi:putative transposase